MKLGTLQQILNTAINAPSGANSQPWSFSASKDLTLSVQIHPDRDHPILNYRNRGTLMALGALLENIDQAARDAGYTAQSSKFNFKDNKVRVSFREGGIESSDLSLGQYIDDRTTNRKSYAESLLSATEFKKLEKAAASEQVGYVICNTVESRSRIAQAFSVFERLMLSHDELRRISFNEIVFSPRPDKSGLHIKTLELAPPKQVMLRLLRVPIIMALAKKAGLPSVIASETASLYASGGVIGALTVKDDDEMFIEAGKIFERIWLQATALGLSLQPITGILFLYQFMGEHGDFFSLEQRSDIRNAYRTISSEFCVPDDRLIALAFRVGHAEAPTLLTEKQTPVIIFE